MNAKNKDLLREVIRFVVIGVYGTLIDLAVEGWITSMFSGWSKGVTNHVAAFFVQFLIAVIGFFVSTPASWSLTTVWGFQNVREDDEKKARSFKGTLRFTFWAFLALLGGAVIQFLGYMTCLEWSGWGINILNDFSFSTIFSAGGSKVLWAWLTVFVIRTAFTMVWNYFTRKLILYRAPKEND